MNRVSRMTLLFSTLGLVVSVAFAEDQFLGSHPRFDEFYTVQEDPQKKNLEVDPHHTMQSIWNQDFAIQIRSKVLSLLSFKHHDENYGDVGEPYNRGKHFGSWVDDPRDRECLNTRAKVLVRDSATKVKFRQNGCTVDSGKWLDPYGGRTYSRASDIQIDHFVPLKNAYISGAWKWDRVKRCLYSNFLGNNFHLLPVEGNENMLKSDNTPEKYMPPNAEYRCQYLAQWLKVKLIWSLGLTPPEKEAVEEHIQRNHCDLAQFQYTLPELETQRQFIAENRDLCQ